MRFEELQPTDTRMKRENMNSIIGWVEKLSNMRVGDGLVMSDGPAGLCLALDANALPRIVIIKLGVSTGSYPSWEDDRYVFPARVSAGPKFDSTDPDLAHTEAFLESPHIDVYNLAKCWMFENDYTFAVQLNGFWWTYNRRFVKGVAAADIAKGVTGNITVGSLTMTALAYYGDTVSGKKVGLEHDGTQWIITEEEC